MEIFISLETAEDNFKKRKKKLILKSTAITIISAIIAA